MKIAFLSFSDYKGGANIAAKSIYKSLKDKKIKKSYLTVYSSQKENYEIYGFSGKFYVNLLRLLEKITIIIF